MTNAIAIIPARGGSKRIEKKNILDFSGKPMIAWTIEAALESKLFSKVIVSTDDEEIANISRQYGASIPFMRNQYADDHSPISVVTIDSLKRLKEELNEEYDTVVQLMANCPLRKAYHIIDAVKNFSDKNALAQISCFKYGWMNPWWAVQLTEETKPIKLFPDALTSRSQDLDELYCPTGAIWIASTKHLEIEGSFYSDETIFYDMPWQAAIDIDDHEDLKMASLLYLMSKS